MKGSLHLVCGLDAAGRSALVSQAFSAPMHISKPWWDEGLLIVNAINATAGLFAGDTVDISLEVRPRAQMLVTSASASRAYRMPSGMAAVKQTVRVADGGWLEMWPSLFIPHAGSNYAQQVSIWVESGGRLLWFETFAPGRVAFGEAWRFRNFESRFELEVDSRLVARETYSLAPGSCSVAALQRQFPAACHAACHAVGGDFTDSLLAEISGLHHGRCWVGCTRLDGPAICVRAVAEDNVHLSRAVTEIRGLLHRAFGRATPALRRA